MIFIYYLYKQLNYFILSNISEHNFVSRYKYLLSMMNLHVNSVRYS
jgi:hypothetical protein